MFAAVAAAAAVSVDVWAPLLRRVLELAAANPIDVVLTVLILFLVYALTMSACASNAEWDDSDDSFAMLSFDERCVEAAPTIPGSAGLANVGNSCYINSVVQCIAAVPPLRAFLDAQPAPAAVAAKRAVRSRRMSP